MKKRSKKGFTLVELLVVIGILAVLAVVSVVGYFGFIKKANISNDVSLTTQMNTILQASEAGGEKYETPHDAVKALEDGGLDVTKLTPTTDGYNYIYDSVNHKMVLAEESNGNFNVKAPEGSSIDSSKKENYFVFVSNADEVAKYSTPDGWSVYLKDGFTSTTLTVNSGLDVGDNENVETINFTSNGQKNYFFRTTGGTLTVEAGNATIKHYGSAKKVDIKAVAQDSFHEFGNVDDVDLQKGRFVAETGSEVSFVNVTATSASDVKIEVETGAEVAAVTATNTTVANEVKNNVTGSVSVVTTEAAEKAKVYFNNSMYETVAKAIEANKKGTIKLLKDITEDITIPSDADLTINLNGKKITNSKTDTIKVKLNGKLTIEGTGVVDNVTHGCACILNNGTTILNGGKFTRSKEASKSTTDSGENSYYNILNHGEMTINDGVDVFSTGAFSSLVVNGYYAYTSTTSGEKTAYIQGTNMPEPKMTINGGSFSGGINTIKNDDNAILTIKDGKFSNVTQSVVQNNNKAYIYGGYFDMPTLADNYQSVHSRNYNTFPNAVYTEIHGGTFEGIVENESTDSKKLVIYGGTFNAGIKGVFTDKR